MPATDIQVSQLIRAWLPVLEEVGAGLGAASSIVDAAIAALEMEARSPLGRSAVSGQLETLIAGLELRRCGDVDARTVAAEGGALRVVLHAWLPLLEQQAMALGRTIVAEALVKYLLIEAWDPRLRRRIESAARRLYGAVTSRHAPPADRIHFVDDASRKRRYRRRLRRKGKGSVQIVVPLQDHALVIRLGYELRRGADFDGALTSAKERVGSVSGRAQPRVIHDPSSRSQKHRAHLARVGLIEISVVVPLVHRDRLIEFGREQREAWPYLRAAYGSLAPSSPLPGRRELQ